jgi:prepilin-type N-terminal cleavage/methylation domain-containing protein
MKRDQGLPAFVGARAYLPSAAPASHRLVKGDQGFPATLMADKPARSAAGFTLLELMITVVILCILLGLAIPGFSRWVPNYRLRGAARDLYSNLQLAKSGAIRDRTEWAIRFTSATTYEIWSARDPDSPTQNQGWNSFSASDDTLVKTVNLSTYGSGVTFGAGSATAPVDPSEGGITAVPASPIYFNSRGFTTNNTVVFAYMTNNRNTSYAVGTLVSGVVVLRRWTGSTWQ